MQSIDEPTAAAHISSLNPEVGQTATFTVQVVDGSDNPIAPAGQTLDVYFDSSKNGNTDGATIDGSSSWTAASPDVVQINPQGLATITVTTPAAGQFVLVTALNGATHVSKQTVSVVGSAAYTTHLNLSNTLGGTSTVAWPTGSMSVGQTLTQFLEQADSGTTGLYVTTENSVGAYTANSGEILEITTSNPSRSVHCYGR